MEAVEVRLLRAINRRLEQELEILKKSHRHLFDSTHPMSCWQFIEQERASYPVELFCRTLAVSPARYYTWRKQQQPALAQPVAANWEEALKETFRQHRRCYGTHRLRV